MRKQYDIAPARKPITQNVLAKELGWHVAALREIENGNVVIDDETYDLIHAAISRLKARKGEAEQCEVGQTTSMVHG